MIVCDSYAWNKLRMLKLDWMPKRFPFSENRLLTGFRLWCYRRCVPRFSHHPSFSQPGIWTLPLTAVGKLACLQSLIETWQLSHGQLSRGPWDDRCEKLSTVSDITVSVCWSVTNIGPWHEGTVKCMAVAAAETGNGRAVQVIRMMMI